MNTLVSEKKIISKSTKRARQSGVVTESLDITPEDAVISILSEILHRQLETAHLQKSFIELGGHSMAAYEFIDKINSRLGIDIGLSELLSMPSILDVLSRFTTNEVSLLASNTQHKWNKEIFQNLSHGQRGQLYAAEMRDTRKPYILVEKLSVSSRKTLSEICQLLEAVIAEVPAVRLCVDQKNEQVKWRFSSKASSVETLDIRGSDYSEKDGDERALFLASMMPDLLDDQGCRFLISQIDTERFDVYIVASHVTFDGWSIEIFFNRFLSKLCELNEQEPPLSVQYAEIELKYLESLQAEQDSTYWYDLLCDAPRSVLERYLKNSQTLTSCGDTIAISLQEIAASRLRALAIRNGLSVYAIVLGSLASILYSLSGQTDIVLGTPVANRELLPPDVRTRSIGHFANIVPVRLCVDPARKTREFISEIQRQLGEMLVHQAYPYEKMIADLRDLLPSTHALFDVVLTYWSHNAPHDNISELSPTRSSLHLETTKYPVEIIVEDHGSTIFLKARYATDLFSKDSISGILNALATHLSEIPDDFNQPLGQLSLMSVAQKDAIALRSDRTSVDWPRDVTIASLFFDQVFRTPNAAAVSFGEEVWTYRELHGEAMKVAASLIAKDVGAGKTIGILMNRGLPMIAAILGTLICGAAYVPIDNSYPVERKSFIIFDAGCSLILTSGAVDIPPESPLVLRMEEIPSTPCHDAPVVRSNDLAYIIYTSGTTGKPKGVMIEHGNVVRLIFNEDKCFDFGPKDVWTMFHSHCFDFSVWEIFGCLLTGGRLVIVPSIVARDPAAFRELLLDERVTILNQTPTAFYNLLNEEKLQTNSDLSVRLVVFGGEALAPGRIKNWRRRYPSCQLCNMYGITETTVHVTYHFLSDEDIASDRSIIGEPIPTLSLFLVDPALRLVPDGFVGEILVGGYGVARGYMNRPSLNAQRFLENPINGMGRVYRSGDLASRSPEGDLVYIGRSDKQVQIRGHRVEPEEIAVIIRNFEGVRDAMVIPCEVEDSGQELAAYWVGEEEAAKDLTWKLGQKLPTYMIPAFITRLEQFPMTVNGKIDLERLPRPERGYANVSKLVIPRNIAEQKIFDLFTKTLGMQSFGVTDDFFDLGGDSMRAVRLSTLSERKIKVIDVYRCRTVEKLAQLSTDDSSLIVGPLSEIKNASPAAIIAIPFAGGNPADFRFLSASLISDNGPSFPLYALNPPGLSAGRFPDNSKKVTDLAKQIVDEMASLNISPTKTIVVGYCVGVATAMAIAEIVESRGSKLGALVLVATAPPDLSEAQPIEDYWADTSDKALLAYLSELGLSITKEAPSELLLDYRSDARRYRQYFIERINKETSKLRVDTTIILGGEDPVTPDPQQCFKRWSDYVFVTKEDVWVVEGAGHYLLVERPERIAEILGPILKRVETGL